MLNFNSEFAFDEKYEVITDQHCKVVGFVYCDGRATLGTYTFDVQDLSDVISHIKKAYGEK